MYIIFKNLIYLFSIYKKKMSLFNFLKFKKKISLKY